MLQLAERGDVDSIDVIPLAQVFGRLVALTHHLGREVVHPLFNLVRIELDVVENLPLTILGHEDTVNTVSAELEEALWISGEAVEGLRPVSGHVVGSDSFRSLL